MEITNELAEMIRVAIGTMAPARRAALEPFLVQPRHETRASYYTDYVGDCWVVAANGKMLIVYLLRAELTSYAVAELASYEKRPPAELTL